MKKLLIVLLTFVFASSAWASVYKWVDDRGVVNYADDMSKVPPAYRNQVEDVSTPHMGARSPSQSSSSGRPSTQAPPIGQTLVREGDFAMKLVESLKIGQAKNEAEAESMLSEAGIAPKNGWIADYPVTPDIIGELQNAVGETAGSGKLGANRDEAMKAFQGLISQEGLPVRADPQSRITGNQDPGSQNFEAQPPQDYPEYYDPQAVNNYYNEQGPPIISYYPPPWDYDYLYSWVPYPFWYTGYWFPGFFVLRDFHRGFFAHGHQRFVSNHFWNSTTRGFGTINPAARRGGTAAASFSRPASGFSSQSARQGASSIFNRSAQHASLNGQAAGLSTASTGSRSGASSSFRGGASTAGPSAGYRSPSAGYSSGRGASSYSHPAYGGSSGPSGGHSGGYSYSHSGGPSAGFSSPRTGVARSYSAPSFSAPSRSSGFSSGSSFHSGGGHSSGGFSGGSRGFSGGGGRGGGRGGGGRGGHR